MTDEPAKPEFFVMPADMTEKDILELFTAMTGRKATAEEIAALRAELARQAEEALRRVPREEG
jgi:hypothetical protein